MAQHILFTAPASLGIGGYYTSTGDVDDVACIIYMTQKLVMEQRKQLVIVICDDSNAGKRYESFMSHLGTTVTQLGVEVLKEVDFKSDHVKGDTSIHIHAPVGDVASQVLEGSIAKIAHVYTQGDDKSVNFKDSEKARGFVAKVPDNKLTRYSTEDTNFVINNDSKVATKLSTDLCKKVYGDYFLFQKRKSFGTAIHLSFLCNRLYSDTGFNGGPGNGVKKYLPLIQELKSENKLPELDGALLSAFNETISHGACDDTAIQNGKDLISLMNLYCHYDQLIVDGRLPNMGNLGDIKKKDTVDPRVAAEFDTVSKSTPLFDFAAAYFALEGGKVSHDVLQKAVLSSLSMLDDSLTLPPPPPLERHSGVAPLPFGGRKSKSKRTLKKKRMLKKKAASRKKKASSLKKKKLARKN